MLREIGYCEKMPCSLRPVCNMKKRELEGMTYNGCLCKGFGDNGRLLKLYTKTQVN